MNHYRNYGRIADGKTPLDDAWKLCKAHPEIKEDFEGQMKIYQWDNVRFAPDDPFWAYWFARHVVKDEWIPGEDLILTNDAVWKAYVQYTEHMRAFGCLGHTLREHPDFVVDEWGIIQGWKYDRGPVLSGGRMAKRKTLVERFGTDDADVIADRIAVEMDDFRKQRKLRNAEGDIDED